MPASVSAPVILAIGGSDSSAGAGIQAELKTIHAHGAYALTVVAAVTAQTGDRVDSVHLVPEPTLMSQLAAALATRRVSAIKIGMIGRASSLRSIAAKLREIGNIPLVVDPVLQASDGTVLQDEECLRPLLDEVFPLATVITPNVLEAEVLSGLPVNDLDQGVIAARQLLHTGCRSVLIKGGHLPRMRGTDVLVTHDCECIFEATDLDPPVAHGTGCTLGAAIACQFARGEAVSEAVRKARHYVRTILAAKRCIAADSGLLDHFSCGSLPQ